MIKTVLFDCWGTLLRAPNLMRRGAAVEFLYESLTEKGYDIDFNSFRDAYVEKARRQREEARSDFRELDYIRRIDSTLQAIEFNHPERRLLVQGVWSEYLAEWPKQSTPYDETSTLLFAIKGKHRLGLVTNFPDGPTARRAFEKFGFRSIFDSIVVSGEVGFRKPNRIIFERVLSELRSTPEQAVMVGDTFDADIVGAKNMGMKAILIDAYGAQSDYYHLPDAVVRSIGEVGEALKQL